MSLVLSVLLRFAAVCCFLAASAASAYVSVPIVASGHVFVVNVTVGTPAQPLSLLLSPSSPHTWVPGAGAMPCMTGYDSLSLFHAPDDISGSACRWGAYTASTSSTEKAVEQKFVDFVVAYTDTINASGMNMTDKLVVGDAEVDDFAMGIVTSISNQQWIGMLGLGNDATTNFPRPAAKYRPNLVDRLVASGKIASPAYSIWLNNPEGTSGSLLLGAIDTSRFEGDLMRLNAAQPYDVFPSAFRVSLAGVNIEGGTSKEGFQYKEPTIAVSLSPAETYSYLPDALAEGIMAATGSTWNTTLNRATIPCDAGSKTPETKLSIRLEGPDGPVLNVRLEDLVIPQDVSRWEIAYETLANLNRNTCLFGIQKYQALQKTGAQQYNLGSSLLRRTYMVFDAANKEVGLAPTNFASPSGTESIVSFDKLGARIPSSRFYCVSGDWCAESTDPQTTQTTTPSGSRSTSSDATEPNTGWKKIVIAVVVPIGALAIFIPLVFFFVRRRRQRAQEKESSFGGKESDTGDEESYREDEYGVKVTVSVSGRVEILKPPSPPELYLGLPGSMPMIPEERNSQLWGDLRGSSLGSGGGSERTGSGKSGERKEVWEDRN